MADDDYSTLPRTQAEAKAAGTRFYFTGNPCKRAAHIAPRYTSTWQCKACQAEHAIINKYGSPGAHAGALRKQAEKIATRKKLVAEMVCSVEGCGRPSLGLFAMCSMHRQRFLKTGQTGQPGPMLGKRGGPKPHCGKRQCPGARAIWAHMDYLRKEEEYKARARAWDADHPHKRRESHAKRRAAERKAMPPWADRKAIAAIYAEAERMTRETGIVHSVDHLVPLRNDMVCGLHVPANLRVIPLVENIRKHNRFSEAALLKLAAD